MNSKVKAKDNKTPVKKEEVNKVVEAKVKTHSISGSNQTRQRIQR